MSVCLELIPKIVLVFGPKWVSYERSRGICRTKIRDFSARVFFAKIQKSQDLKKYTILRFFRIQFMKNVPAQIYAGPAPWARPMGRAHIWALARPIHGPGPYRDVSNIPRIPVHESRNSPIYMDFPGHLKGKKLIGFNGI